MVHAESVPLLPAPRDVIATLARMRDTASREEFLDARPRLVGSAVVEQLADAAREQLRIDVQASAALSEAAVLIAGRVGSKGAMARALRAKANALWFANDLRTAVSFFEEAACLFEADGDPGEVGRTLSSMIQSLVLLGEYDRASAAADRARAIFTELGDDHRLARLDLNLANMLHRQDRLAQALDMYERACVRLVAYQDGEGIGVALHNMAVCLIAMNEFDRALAIYAKAREHCARAGMPRMVAQADYNIAYLHYLRGDYRRALDMLRDARVACQRSGDSYHTALCDLDQSDIYLELNLTVEAAQMAERAYALFERIGNGYESARALTNLAMALGQRGEHERALTLFADARTRFEHERNTAWPSVIDFYRAIILCRDERFTAARAMCGDALTHFQGAGLVRKAIQCELLLARIDLHTGDTGSALGHCRSVMAASAANESPLLTCQAHLVMGLTQEATGNRDAAYASYQMARERLEALRSVLGGEDLKIAFMANAMEVYERLVHLCLARDGGRHSAEEIFQYVEQAKSRSLRDRLGEPPAWESSGDEVLAGRVDELRRELNWYYHRLEREQLSRDGQSSARLDRLQRDMRGREQEFVGLLRELPRAGRESLGLSETAPVPLGDVQDLLGADRTLVEYFVTDERVVAVVVRQDRLDVVPLAKMSRIQPVLQLLQFQLSKLQGGPEYLALVGTPSLDAVQVHLRELHDDLIAPLGIAHDDHLVVVPHDALHHVPFHALFDGMSYLIDRATVSYAPSASVYALCRRRPPTTGGGSLVLGVPDDRAPFIREEVEAVARLLPFATMRLDKDATSTVLRDEGPGSHIVHIATHGYFREDNPLFSGIRLGDVRLTLHDLLALRLPADLVTLSGCGTGVNAVAAGDELQGLSRGLLAAGARSVLVSLWDVDDESSSDFMKAFYCNLAAGKGKAAALRNACGGLRAKYPHPYFWAPFVLVGDDGTTEER